MLASFEALDLLDGLRQGDWQQTLSPKRVAKIIAGLERDLPPAVQTAVMPRCRGALKGLQAVGDGFLKERRVDEDGVRWIKSDGTEDVRSLDRLVPAVIRQIRNGGHTYNDALLDADKRQLSRQRSSRSATASAYLYRAAGVPLVVFADHAGDYFQALHAADLGDSQAVVQFIEDRALDALGLLRQRLEAVQADHASVSLGRLLKAHNGLTHREVESIGRRIVHEVQTATAQHLEQRLPATIRHAY